jgi:hypothetical protein
MAAQAHVTTTDVTEHFGELTEILADVSVETILLCHG